MPSAVADLVTLAYVAETTWGSTPTTPTFQYLRYKSEGLKQDTQTIESQEIQAGRQTPAFYRVGVSASGPIVGEFTHETYDDWLQASLFSAGWSTQVTVTDVSGNATAAASDNSISSANITQFNSFVVGQWVSSSGWTTNGTGGVIIGKIVTKTGAKITLSHCTIVNETNSATVTTKMGSQILNGTTPKSFNVERKYTDLTNKFVAYKGVMPATFSFTVTKDAILLVTFDTLADKEYESSSTLSTGGTPTAANTNEAFNAIDDVQGIFENGTATDFTDWSIQMQNNLRQRMVIGHLGAVSIGAGRLSLTGACKMYFDGGSQATRYINFTSTSFAIKMWRNGKGYVIELPAIKFSKGDRPAGGINTDVMFDGTFTAFQDSVSGITVRIARFT